MVVTDTYGHGTHVAGTIAATDNEVGNIGVAPDAGIYVIKASNEGGIFYNSDIIRGLNKCVELGNIDIVNMSLGGYGSNDDFRQAMENCADHGILCVSAAGNDATDRLHYPSAYKIGLSVAAYNSSKPDELAWFSNYGGNYNIVAPGVNICSAYLNGGYGWLNGTSMATPHVSGVAALIYGAYDIPKTREGADRVRDIIISNNDGIRYSFEDRYATGGVDIQKIFRSAYVRTPEAPKPSITVQADTKQSILSFEPTDAVIYYTLNGKKPDIYTSKVYTEPVHLDKAGKYKIKAIAVNKRSSSTISKATADVPANVISQYRVGSVTLSCKEKYKAGKTFTVKVSNNGKAIPAERFKWKCNKPEIATVDRYGNVTISPGASSGTTFKVKAILGGIKNKVKITIK